MRHTELIQKVSELHPYLEHDQIKSIYDLIVQEIQNELLKGGRVTLRGLGTIKSYILKARKYPDLVRNTYVEKPDMLGVRFRPSKKFRDRLRSEGILPTSGQGEE